MQPPGILPETSAAFGSTYKAVPDCVSRDIFLPWHGGVDAGSGTRSLLYIDVLARNCFHAFGHCALELLYVGSTPVQQRRTSTNRLVRYHHKPLAILERRYPLRGKRKLQTNGQTSESECTHTTKPKAKPW